MMNILLAVFEHISKNTLHYPCLLLYIDILSHEAVQVLSTYNVLVRVDSELAWDTGINGL